MTTAITISMITIFQAPVFAGAPHEHPGPQSIGNVSCFGGRGIVPSRRLFASDSCLLGDVISTSDSVGDQIFQIFRAVEFLKNPW